MHRDDRAGAPRRPGGSGIREGPRLAERGQAAILLAARDGAVDGREKLRRLAPGMTVLDYLTSDEMGRAFGRDQAVHAVLAPGALAGKLELEARRLKGFRA